MAVIFLSQKVRFLYWYFLSLELDERTRHHCNFHTRGLTDRELVPALHAPRSTFASYAPWYKMFEKKKLIGKNGNERQIKLYHCQKLGW